MSTKRKRKKNVNRNERKPPESVREKVNEGLTRPDAWIYRHVTTAIISHTIVLATQAAVLGAITGWLIFSWLEENNAGLWYYTTLLLVGTAAQIAFSWGTALAIIPRAAKWARQRVQRFSDERRHRFQVKDEHEQKVLEDAKPNPKVGPALLATVGIAHTASQLEMDMWPVIWLSALAAACIVATRNMTDYELILRMTGRIKDPMAQ